MNKDLRLLPGGGVVGVAELLEHRSSEIAIFRQARKSGSQILDLKKHRGYFCSRIVRPSRVFGQNTRVSLKTHQLEVVWLSL